jgi:hypothetical protein
MNWLDGLVVTYVLERQGVPFDLIEHFIDVLSQGIAVGDLDSIAARAQMIEQARVLAAGDDDVGENILALIMHIEHYGQDTAVKNNPVSDASQTPETGFAYRIALRRAAATLAKLQELQQSA